MARFQRSRGCFFGATLDSCLRRGYRARSKRSSTPPTLPSLPASPDSTTRPSTMPIGHLLAQAHRQVIGQGIAAIGAAAANLSLEGRDAADPRQVLAARPQPRQGGRRDGLGRFHSFRHTCASLLFDEGRNVKQVQEWLGHSDPAFTLRTYVHLIDNGVGAADFLDEAVAATASGNGGSHRRPLPLTPPDRRNSVVDGPRRPSGCGAESHEPNGGSGMRQKIKRPSHATVIACLALFVALGGGAMAASQLGKNSVGAKQLKANAVTTKKIKKEAVTTKKLKKGAVNGSKVQEHSLTGTQINLSTLGTVPSAEHGYHG